MAWTDIVIQTAQGPKPGHRCDRHAADFLRGGNCHECIVDPDPTAPAFRADYDRKLAARVSEYRTYARRLRGIADDLLDGTDRDVAAACKAIAEATKLDRLAEERQEVIDAREHDLTLCAHEERMSAQRGGH